VSSNEGFSSLLGNWELRLVEPAGKMAVAALNANNAAGGATV
jgi:hypothetical protein